MKKLKKSSRLDRVYKPKDLSNNSLKIEIEENLMRLLTAYVLLRRKEPINAILEDLFKLEVQAGLFLSDILKDNALDTKIRGSLASLLSLIPFSNGLDKSRL